MFAPLLGRGEGSESPFGPGRYGLLVKVADFCDAPNVHFAELAARRLDLGESAARLVAYYASCGGTHPLAASLDAARAAARDLAAAAAGDALPAPAALTAAAADALAAVDALAETAHCSNVTPVYQELVHRAVCRSLVGGLYYLAIAHGAAAAMLYLFLFACNLVSETIFLVEELEDLATEVMATDRYKARTRSTTRVLKTELQARPAPPRAI